MAPNAGWGTRLATDRRSGQRPPPCRSPAAFALVAPGLDALLVPVMAYMTAIGTMLWRAAAWLAAGCATQGVATVSPSGGVDVAGAARLALIGAIVFAISDTVIALDRFHAPVPGARYFIIVTYWAALALIAASAVLYTGRELHGGRE